jgi:hypothetical protein
MGRMVAQIVVGNTIPVQQDAFLKTLVPSQKAFLKIGQLWRLYRKLLKGLEKDLPEK